ncbi:hypothetical protein PGB90_003272 [Kerria lacca]
MAVFWFLTLPCRRLLGDKVDSYATPRAFSLGVGDNATISGGTLVVHMSCMWAGSKASGTSRVFPSYHCTPRLLYVRPDMVTISVRFPRGVHGTATATDTQMPPPQAPRIENNGTQVVPNHNVTVRTDDKAVLKCVSRYGNPPALLKWFLDDEELMSKSNQTNIQEEDNRRTYMAMSTLEMFVNKTHHGRMVKCIAIHESYASKSQAVEVRLDITCFNFYVGHYTERDLLLLD